MAAGGHLKKIDITYNRFPPSQTDPVAKPEPESTFPTLWPPS